MGTLDGGLKKNPYVRIGPKGGGRITLTPLDAQPDPPNLTAFKAELNATWPMTSLLDMVKETDLRLGFTDVLKSPTAYEMLERSVLQPRLLLCLHGIGINAGLQRMAGLESGVTAKDLSYVRRRYISVDALRRAIAIVADGTLKARNPAIWGSGTTACASDSKHFGAWDQNLTTQWHVRYSGRGIMIYWHVERNSLCIHSQLKSPSSSEVASMIEGVIHHCTEMEVDRQYVDSHGQSTIAFAFCRLLGFLLLPRLKAIHSQKLYRPETGKADAYASLQLILSKPIDWDLVSQQYDQMIKYTTALRLGTAETEAILRRFTKKNLQHPTYKAFAELGKAIKTIFLCHQPADGRAPAGIFGTRRARRRHGWLDVSAAQAQRQDQSGAPGYGPGRDRSGGAQACGHPRPYARLLRALDARDLHHHGARKRCAARRRAEGRRPPRPEHDQALRPARLQSGKGSEFFCHLLRQPIS